MTTGLCPVILVSSGSAWLSLRRLWSAIEDICESWADGIAARFCTSELLQGSCTNCGSYILRTLLLLHIHVTLSALSVIMGNAVWVLIGIKGLVEHKGNGNSIVMKIDIVAQE